MQLLRRTGHNPDGVSSQISDSIVDRGDVAGGVIEAAVTLPDNGRLIPQLGNVTEENANRPFADFGEPAFAQSIDHLGQSVIVETFAALDVIMDVQQRVGPFEFLL